MDPVLINAPQSPTASFTPPDNLSQPGTPTAVAPAATPAVAVPAAAAPAAPAAGSDLASLQAQINPIAADQAAHQKAAADLAATPIPPDAPHARLMGMVKGLALGLSAFGTSMATRGKEGGAQEVADVQGKQQDQKIQAQQAQLAAKNAQVQAQLMAANINGDQIHNIMLMHSLKNSITTEDANTMKAQQDVQKNTIDISNARHDSMQTYGIDPLTPPTASQLSNMDGASKVASGLIAFASDPRVLGPNNPAVKDAQDALTKAQQSNDPEAVAMAVGGLRRAIDFSSKATDMGIKQAQLSETSPLGTDKVTSLNAGLLRLYQISSPNAKTLPTGMSLPDNATPKDYDRVKDLVEKSQNATSMQASRELADQIRQQNLLLLKGPDGIDPKVVGQAYLDQLKVADPASAAEYAGYASGKLEFPAASVRTPSGQALLKNILRAYPDFDPSLAPAYVKLRNEFTAGKTGAALNSYNTTLDHLSRMLDNVNSASVIDVNNPKSAVYQRLDSEKSIVSSELAKAVSNGSMTEGERDAALKAIDGKVLGVEGPAAYKTKLRETVSLLGGKANAYASQWQAGVPKGVDLFPTVDQAQKTTARILGGDTAPATPAAPTGPDPYAQFGKRHAK